MKRLRSFFALLIVVLAPHQSLLADGPPYPCIGFNPGIDRWGEIGPDANCPDGYAYLGTVPMLGIASPGKYLALMGDCCRIADDILTDTHEYQMESCPADHVATGARFEGKDERRETWSMRCTKINTGRYQLAEPSEGYQWGLKKDFRHYLHNVKAIGWSRIPLGLRYGIGRVRNAKPGKRRTDGCIGYPFGSLLVSKTHKLCHGIYFSQLQYRGAPGDPPAGTPVEIIPKCAAISDPNDRNATCIK